VRGAITALVDGAPHDRIGVADRGLQYGDGLFETIKMSAGRPRLWDRHLARLCHGAARLGLAEPDGRQLYGEVMRLAAGADGVIKLILTRGEGPRGYRPVIGAAPRRILSLHRRPQYPSSWSQTGVDVVVCRTQVSDNPSLAGLKHLNRLDQVLARAEWNDLQVAEGLMCDAAGRVIGGTMTNLFLVQGDRLVTPDLGRCGVAGTVRAAVLDLAPRLGLSVAKDGIWPRDLFAAEGAFLTNAVIGIWPIRTCGGRSLPGRPPAELVAAVAQAANDLGEAVH